MMGFINNDNISTELMEEILNVNSRRITESEYFSTARLHTGLFIVDYEENLDLLPERNNFALYAIVEDFENTKVRTSIAIKIAEEQPIGGVPLYVANTIFEKDSNGEVTGNFVRPKWIAINALNIKGLFEGDMSTEALSYTSGEKIINILQQLGTLDLENGTFVPTEKAITIADVDGLEERLNTIPTWNEF